MRTYLRWLVGALALATLLSGCGDKLAGSRQGAATSTAIAVVAAVDRELPTPTLGEAAPSATEEPAAAPSPTFVPTAEPSATPVPVAPTDTPAPVIPTETATPEPVAPTDTPAPIAPTATSAALPVATTPEELLALLGPEWLLADSGDTNHDGIMDIIAYVPTESRPREGALKSDPEYNIFIQRAAIVQLGPENRPQLLVEVSSRELRTADAILVPYSTYNRMPAFYALRARAEDNTPLAVIGVEQNGEIYGQGVGVYWDEAVGRYGRVADDARRADGFPSPTPTGIDWQTYASADYGFSIAYPRCFTELVTDEAVEPPLLHSLVLISQDKSACPMDDMRISVHALDDFRLRFSANSVMWYDQQTASLQITISNHITGEQETVPLDGARVRGEGWQGYEWSFAGDAALASRTTFVPRPEQGLLLAVGFVRDHTTIGSDDLGLERAILRTLRMGR